MIGYAQSKGLKSTGTAKFAIIATGILVLIGGLSILTGYRVQLGLTALAIFLFGVTFKMHAFWKEADPVAKYGDKIQFMKNMALLGAVLMLLASPIAWGY
jgi:uncharacterized membrane protein YphA (DoxX/SURF4 family)